MKSDLTIFTGYISQESIEAYIRNKFLPIFIVRNIKNSKLIGKFSNTPIHLRCLSPSTEIYREKKEGLIDFITFAKKYIIEQSEVNFQDVIKKLEQLAKGSEASGVVLLGYPKDPGECHRSFLGNILNTTGILTRDVREYIFSPAREFDKDCSG